MKARDLPPRELIEKLKEEHKELPDQIDDAILTFKTGNLSGAFPLIADIREKIGQHTIDEEAVLLKIIIEKLGKEAAEPYIEILQAHVKITKLVDDAVESTYTGWSETENLLLSLKQELKNHHAQEEETFFPKVLQLIS